MSELSEYIEAHLPDGWFLANLIHINPGFQANICDGERVAIGTGETMEEALLVAGSKAADHITVGRLAMLSETMKLFRKEQAKMEGNGSSLLSALGLAVEKPKIPRRM